MKVIQSLRGTLAETVLMAFRKEIAWIFCFSLIANVLMLTPTLYMMQIYDRVIAGQSLTSLLVISITFLSLMLWLTYAQWVRAKLMIVWGNNMEYALSNRLFSASLTAYFKNKNIEPSRYLRAMVEFKQFLVGSAAISFLDLIWTPLYVFVAFMVHPILGWVSIAILGVQLALIIINHIKTNEYQQNKLEKISELKGFLSQNLRSVLPIHAMGFAGFFKSRWLAMEKDARLEEEQSRQAIKPLQSAMHFFRYATQTASLGVAAYLAVNAEISMGSMIAANMIISRVIAPLDQLTQAWSQVVGFLKSNELLTPYLLNSSEIHQVSNATEGLPELNKIRIEGLSAKYNDTQANVINNASFELNAGEVVVVMGPSGSGKTSLVKSLMGLLPIAEGQCIINDSLSSAFGHQTLRIGYLPQDFQLFEGSVAENIARFEEIDSNAVTQAAMFTGVHDWALRLPSAYDTMIGAHGMALSGGQRQQLGLARAIYNNNPLIVLDEPNSNLDELAEQALHKLIMQLKQNNAIVLVISHKPQILNVADKIMWLEAGAIKVFDEKSKAILKIQQQSQPS